MPSLKPKQRILLRRQKGNELPYLSMGKKLRDFDQKRIDLQNCEICKTKPEDQALTKIEQICRRESLPASDYETLPMT